MELTLFLKLGVLIEFKTLNSITLISSNVISITHHKSSTIILHFITRSKPLPTPQPDCDINDNIISVLQHHRHNPNHHPPLHHSNHHPTLHHHHNPNHHPALHHPLK